jgi:hypothetical protein
MPLSCTQKPDMVRVIVGNYSSYCQRWINTKLTPEEIYNEMYVKLVWELRFPAEMVRNISGEFENDTAAIQFEMSENSPFTGILLFDILIRAVDALCATRFTRPPPAATS